MSRLDLALVEQGLVRSRTLAARLISSGFVTVNGKAVQKPSYPISSGDTLSVLENELTHFVSRGALKLEHALIKFKIEVSGKTVFDFGASTGGFCQCLLEHGAARVYAVDVGKHQLAPEIREDPRVVCLEETDARALTERQIPEPCDLGVMDVSFISQGLLYEACARCLLPGADLIALYKPQFEVGRENVAKGGIVRDRRAVQLARAALIERAALCGLKFQENTESPILGGDGNREELLHFVRKSHV